MIGCRSNIRTLQPEIEMVNKTTNKKKLKGYEDKGISLQYLFYTTIYGKKEWLLQAVF
jgi:hypothetical protein